SEAEVSTREIRRIFQDTYIDLAEPMNVVSYQAARTEGLDKLSATIKTTEANVDIAGEGKGILDAFVNAINFKLNSKIILVDYSEHTLGDNQQSEAMAYVQLGVNGQRYCGAGCSEDIVGASLRAVLNAIARAGIDIKASSNINEVSESVLAAV
ncbi:MAG: 2-isopropylmalate synthase, partial [Candidatus Azotimanducaceae bacterium]